MITVPRLGRFSHLRQGMTVLVGSIGGKMIVAPVRHVPTLASPSVFAVIIAGAAASRRHGSRHTPRTAPDAGPDVPGAPRGRASLRRSTA